MVLFFCREKNPNLKPPIASWRPEYGRYMIEGTPFAPYFGCMKCLLQTEENMRARRQEVQNYLKDDELILSMTSFPLMGAKPNVTFPESSIGGEFSNSSFLPDALINPHPRFAALTRNIRQRRGEKVCILVPLYLDKHTNKDIGWQVPSYSCTKSEKANANVNCSCCSPTQYLNSDTNKSITKIPSILGDAMGFGMGCCCLQVTFQARDISEARLLYDQLLTLCPIMLAVTAATPFFRGLIADTDVRWNIISASVDDRTEEERKTIAKSRYDSVSLYIQDNADAEKYSDINAQQNTEAYNMLLQSGLDKALARHLSHLFIRDPLVIFDNAKSINDETESDHFENIQSTNWQSVRFKPPPPNSTIGWRVEFRVMEVQMTDFENAAFMIFMVLITRIIISYGINLMMPISKVDANMAKAHARNAVLKEKFYFRKNISKEQAHEEAQVDLLTVDEILNGCKDFVGIIPLVRKYLDQMNPDFEVRAKIESYLELISKRASGELQTAATYMRDFVMNHPQYKNDSVLTDDIVYDLVDKVNDISTEKVSPKELYGNVRPSKAASSSAASSPTVNGGSG